MFVCETSERKLIWVVPQALGPVPCKGTGLFYILKERDGYERGGLASASDGQTDKGSDR